MRCEGEELRTSFFYSPLWMSPCPTLVFESLNRALILLHWDLGDGGRLSKLPEKVDRIALMSQRIILPPFSFKLLICKYLSEYNSPRTLHDHERGQRSVSEASERATMAFIVGIPLCTIWCQGLCIRPLDLIMLTTAKYKSFLIKERPRFEMRRWPLYLPELIS